MSTINSQLYTKSVSKLADSIRIKSSHVAKADNAYVTSRGFSVSEDPTTWKYYLNLSGKYHPVDTPMTVKSLDTMLDIPFERAVLLNHRATLREYALKEDYYDALVDRYPTQEFLIKGILDPVDIDYAINAPDFTVIYYDKALVEPQETNLIPELQEFITTTSRRFFVPSFTITDELYVHAYISVLKTYIGEKIENIRLSNCHTYHAHSYYIWEYLESSGRLSAYKQVLTLEQTLWLYRNIRWVYMGIGRQDTFAELMNTLLTRRGIPLGSYDMKHGVEEMPDSLTPEPLMVRSALNLRESLSELTTTNSLSYLMERQSSLAAYNFDALEYSLPQARLRLTSAKQNTVPTMVYESELVDLKDSEPFLIADVLLNHWISMAATNRYRAAITVQNPQTTDIMTLNMKEAFLTWLYLYNRGLGSALIEVPSVVAVMTIRLPVPTFDELRSVTNTRWVKDWMINQILDEAPEVGSPISTESFYATCSAIHKNALRRREHYSSAHHKEVRRDLETIFMNLYETREYKLNEVADETYLTYFANRGWDMDALDKQDSMLLADEIITKATGLDTQDVLSLSEIQSTLLKLMRQLGTYTTHYIQTINSTAVLPAGPLILRVGETSVSESSTVKLTDYTVEVQNLTYSERTTVPMTVANMVINASWSTSATYVPLDMKVRARVQQQTSNHYRARMSKVRARVIEPTIQTTTITE